MNTRGGGLPVHNIVSFSLCVGKSMMCDRITGETCDGMVVIAVSVTQEQWGSRWCLHACNHV